MAKYIVTSALPYVQTIIHLGNLIGSILPADKHYKFLKMSGEDAIFICGSDEHGTAMEITALREHTTPQELSERNHRKIKELLEKYECTFTNYGKTDSEENKRVTYEIFNGLLKNGNIVKSDSEQPYCNIDKRFISDRFIEGTCPYCKFDGARGDQCDSCGKLLDPRDLIKPRCTICGKSEITFRKVANLALNLEKLQHEIKKFIDEKSKYNWSKNAINHSNGYISKGLKNREITRSVEWGFPVPMAGFEDKRYYVWFDAVCGYIGITYEWDRKKADLYWKGKDTKIIHFMGKDNIEFHTLIFPGMLIGSDVGYTLPTTVYAYEYLMWEGKKFSKSRGVGLNIEEALSILPADYWRFALASILPENADADFSLESFRQAVDNDLNNVMGNFVHRTLTLVKNNFEGKVPKAGRGADEEGENTLEMVNDEVKKYGDNFRKIEIREALRNVVRIAAIGNEYLSGKEPWKMIKAGRLDEAAAVLNICTGIAYKMGILLYPFTPAASEQICKVFDAGHELKLASSVPKEGKQLNLDGLKPLFSKLTDEQIERIERFSGKTN